MSKHNNHHFKATRSDGPRYRFQLPGDLRTVKLLAFAQGIISATEQRKAGQDLSIEAIEAGSIQAAILTEQQKHAGRVGCNDPVAFRKIFADLCAKVWAGISDYWEQEPKIYEDFQRRPPQQRLANAQLMAELYLDPVEKMIADGEPIVFEW